MLVLHSGASLRSEKFALLFLFSFFDSVCVDSCRRIQGELASTPIHDSAILNICLHINPSCENISV